VFIEIIGNSTIKKNFFISLSFKATPAGNPLRLHFQNLLKTRQQHGTRLYLYRVWTFEKGYLVCFLP
jgi:hypothetical protein